MKENDHTGRPDDVEQADGVEQTDDAEPLDSIEVPSYDEQMPKNSEPFCGDDFPDDVGSSSNTGQADSAGQTNDTGQASSTRLTNSSTTTEGELVSRVTYSYLNALDQIPRSSWPSPEQMANDVVRDMDDLFTLENINRGKGCGLPVPRKLWLGQIALLMARVFCIVRIFCEGEDPDHDLLAIYKDDGENKGIYVQSKDEFHALARRFYQWLLPRECENIIDILRTLKEVPRVTRCRDRDLIAVNNGVFNYKTKKLLPFSPDYVFLAKSPVDYKQNPKNPTIYNDEDGTRWDVESWIKELSDDTGIQNLIWEILGAIIRPFVRWKKSAWLYSDVGNNGKGTLCELMRQLCGENSYTAIPLKDFGKDFALESLTRAIAIITDENDVGTFVDEAANLKAVITNDVIHMNRKFKVFISYQFYGFMVQCLNEFPRFKDKTDSFYRRQLFIPFEKCFTGQEREYIKEDYVHRKEVLEYVLWRVLNMNYYQLSNPERCQNVLEEYKEFNDPVRQFFYEMDFQFVWGLLPFGFLYDLYRAWSYENNPGGAVLGRNKFIKELANVTKTSQRWDYMNTKVSLRPGKKMSDAEPLIIQYDLKNWKSKTYRGKDPGLIAVTTVQDVYHGGLVRRNNTLQPLNIPNPEEDADA